MEYISCQEVAKRRNLTVRRVQQMCKNGEIMGAVRKGKSWVIPDDSKEEEKNGSVSVFSAAARSRG